MKTNICLIGFMGSGKSTIAKILSKKLNKKLIEMDEIIIAKTKYNSINEIFDHKGELFFRELEIATAKELNKIEKAIISTGGGVVMNKIIIDYLKQNSLIFYLKTNFSTIKTRLTQDFSRPLFNNLKTAKQLFSLRAPLYEYYSDYQITTDNKTPSQIADKIIEIYNNFLYIQQVNTDENKKE
ncbi:MAG: shikimate kinase [Patescibacteria group bacterium]|nr:MAG: shikimate kinase [Patescibacteria group bacterium]